MTREMLELPIILHSAPHCVKIVRRDDYGNLYCTRRLTKEEARDFLKRNNELTENAEKELSKRK